MCEKGWVVGSGDSGGGSGGRALDMERGDKDRSLGELCKDSKYVAIWGLRPTGRCLSVARILRS